MNVKMEIGLVEGLVIALGLLILVQFIPGPTGLSNKWFDSQGKFIGIN